MSPLELAALIISAATQLKSAGMTLEKDPSEDFEALATLVAIAYAENEQGENIGSGQSTLYNKEGEREVSFGPFQINEFWYKDHSDSGDVTVVNNEYTDIFKGASRDDMIELLQDPYNSAVAAVIVANSNNGYENWSTYNSDVYGIKDKDFNSKYWQAGFRSASEKLYEVEEETVDVGDMEDKDMNDTNETVLEEGALGQERREKGYSEREIASFKRGVDQIAGMMNKVNPQNPTTQKQASLWLANQMGMDIQDIPLDIKSDYDKVSTVILNFVGELGKAKAR